MITVAEKTILYRQIFQFFVETQFKLPGHLFSQIPLGMDAKVHMRCLMDAHHLYQLRISSEKAQQDEHDGPSK